MKICVIGTGYVGLVVGTCLAQMGNSVICVDKNKEKLEQLKKGIVPIYEPDLEEMIISNVKENRLEFSLDLNIAIQKSEICYIAVQTPQNEDGSADMTCVFEVSKEIGKALNDYKIIINKSTAPVGSADEISKIIKSYTQKDFDVVSNPEFLKQGSAVEDFLKPDRIIIGTNSKKAIEIMDELYFPFKKAGIQIIYMDNKSAEMAKYASNAFLAMKISYANEIANICEKIGADSQMVRVGMCSDKRIGQDFLFAGLGYGGSCFPKDVEALIKTAKENNCSYELLNATKTINKKQREIFIDKILNRFSDDVKNKTFAIWGLSFKPKTNDLREAPSITIIKNLLEKGAKIVAYDPRAIDKAKEIFENKIKYASSAYEALNNSDALLLLTEWSEFKHPDFDKMKNLMKTPIIFDGRNQYDGDYLAKKRFEYFCVGKKIGL